VQIDRSWKPGLKGARVYKTKMRMAFAKTFHFGGGAGHLYLDHGGKNYGEGDGGDLQWFTH
jgi:hypothetical protein